MPLTTQTDYALRTLMFLASRSERATVADVARLFDISVHHVGKVVNLLSRYGYLRSIRGIGGGIELAQRPEDISLGEVIERFEGNLHLLECVDTENVCAIQSFCKLKDVLAEAEQVQVEFLNRFTLADVAPRRRQFRQLDAHA